jgi:hypothetical protein
MQHHSGPQHACSIVVAQSELNVVGLQFEFEFKIEQPTRDDIQNPQREWLEHLIAIQMERYRKEQPTAYSIQHTAYT